MISENIVVQSNPLIEAQYKLSETEQKLLRVLISMIKPDTPDFQKRFYRISVQDFSKFSGHLEDHKMHQKMRQMAHNLKMSNVKIIKPDGNTIETSWVASFEYPKNKGWIEFEISSKLENELLRVKEQFTQYYLANISKLKGEYTVRVYELVRQYANSRLRSRINDLNGLKKVFGLNNEYSDNFNFFRRVIHPAHKEICAKTDISFSFRPIKESRKIVAVEFYDIRFKTLTTPSILALIPQKHKKNKVLINDIKKHLDLHGPDYVTEKINYTLSRTPENFADYLHSALTNNYGEGYNQDSEAPKVIDFPTGTVFEFGGKRYTFNENGLRISNSKILNPEEISNAIKVGLLTIVYPEQLEKEQQEKLEAQYDQYRQKAIDAYLSSLSSEERKAAEERFLQGLDVFSRGIFQEKGWDSPVINSMWRLFLSGHTNLLSIEKYKSGRTNP